MLMTGTCSCAPPPSRTEVLMYSTYITSRPGKRVVGMQESPEPHSTAAVSGVGILKIRK